MPSFENIYVKKETEDEENNSITQAETFILETKHEAEYETLKQENYLSYDSDNSDFNDQSDTPEAPEYFELKNYLKEDEDNIDQSGPAISCIANFTEIIGDSPSDNINIQDGRWTDGTFKCGSCAFSTDKEIVLEAHVRDCLLEARYSSMLASILAGIRQRCYFCPFESDNLDALKEHHHFHTNQGQTANYECQKCGFSTEKRFQLVTHILTHNKFKCAECPYFHTYENSVKRHSKNHCFSVKLIAACKSCSFKAADRGAWEGHLTAHKLCGQAIDITCAMCTFRGDTHYNQRSVEVHHKQFNHRGFLAEMSMFRCVETSCSFTTYFRWDFVRHAKTNHPEASPVGLNNQSCSKCSFVATSVSQLSEHFQNIHARTVYKCDGCQFETKRKERYNLHMIDVKLTQRHDKKHHSINDLKLYRKHDLGNFANLGQLDTNESRGNANLTGAGVTNKHSENLNLNTGTAVSLDINKDTAYPNKSTFVKTTDSLNLNTAKTISLNAYSELVNDAKVLALNNDISKNPNPTINAASVVPFNTHTEKNKEVKNEDITLLTDISKNPNLNINAIAELSLKVCNSDIILKADISENPNVTINAASVIPLNAYKDKNEEIKIKPLDGDLSLMTDLSENPKLNISASSEVPLNEKKIKIEICDSDIISKHPTLALNAAVVPLKAYTKKNEGIKNEIVDIGITEANSAADNLNLKRKGDEIPMLESDEGKKTKTSPYKCFYCDFAADKIDVDRHEKTAHRTFDGLYTCPYCSYESTKRCDVRRHYTRKHKESLKCNHCTFETGSKSEFIQHTASHKRSGLKLHYCSVCEYSSNKTSMVRRHELTHRDTGLFCEHCDYKCRRKDDLARHKSKKHAQVIEVVQYKCLTCPIETSIEVEFESHLVLHIGYNHTILFKCTECGHRFSDQPAFSLHQNELKHSLYLIAIEILYL